MSESNMEEKNERAIFAAGCFWGIESAFRKTPGVVDAVSGYTGGHLQNPTYRAVCGGDSGHAEAVQVFFDPDQIDYARLLEAFWRLHDPTQVDRQGPDVGSQYRSAIFFVDEAQRLAAEESKRAAQSRFARPIATRIEPAAVFWQAEEYHQRYFEKLGRG